MLNIIFVNNINLLCIIYLGDFFYVEKRCKTGSYDFCDKDGLTVFQIFKNVSDFEKGGVLWGGQVFKKENEWDCSSLIFDRDFNLFLIRCIIMANDMGWDIRFEDVDMFPDFSSLPEYESFVYTSEWFNREID